MSEKELRSDTLQRAVNSIQRFSNLMAGVIDLGKELERIGSLKDHVDALERRNAEAGAREAIVENDIASRRAELNQVEGAIQDCQRAAELAQAEATARASAIVAAAEEQAGKVIKQAEAALSEATADRKKAEQILADASAFLRNTK
jgi:uncharacterized protein YoxC